MTMYLRQRKGNQDMEMNDIANLFTYRPDREAVRKRMISEAKEIYAKGLTKERHQPIFQDLKGQLGKFYLYPTFNCPLHCPYCFAEGGERKTKELSAKEFLRITQEAIAEGFKTIVISGGEPLVYHDFENYLDGLLEIDRKKCWFVLRSSLAFPIPDERLQKLCVAFDEITASIDGDEETHDAIRGKGSFRYVMDNTLRILSLGGNISISAVMDKEAAEGNPGQFLKTFSKDHHIRKLVLQSPMPLGRAIDTKVPYYEWRSGKERLDRVQMKYSCGLGHNLYMEPDGKTYPCYAWCGKEHLLADLSKESLHDVLAQGSLLAILNTGVDTNEKCSSCEVRYFCGGMCKIWVKDKSDINSGDFDCEEQKKLILAKLRRYGIIDTVENDDVL